MTTSLPTVALTLSRVPRERDHSPFFRVFDGYAEAGDKETMREIKQRAQEKGVGALTIQELRIEHFRTQRAQRHAGGPYGPNDVQDLWMEVIRAEIRYRLRCLGTSCGLWVGDITRLDVDVIVTAANQALSGGGGVDGAIHKAAGPELLSTCLAIPEVSPAVRCPVGSAVITPGFRLRSPFVIHAVGPVWKGGEHGERALLASAYREGLRLAFETGKESIAFPAISTGAYGSPKHEAARIAVDTARAFQAKHSGPERIVFVAFGPGIEKSLRAALGPDDLT
ncbi:MAG: macro domain-containing protein [Bacteroidota bacterium]